MSSSSDHVVDLLDDYLHDLLSPQERDRVDGHCARCDACARAMKQAQYRFAVVRAVPPAEPSANLAQHTLHRIASERLRRRRLRKRILWTVLPAFAAAVLLLIGANLYYYNLRANSIDLLAFGQNRLLAATSASLRIRLIDRAGSGTVLAGVPVIVTIRAPDGREEELARFDTDAQGSGNPRFDLPDWADGDYELRITAKTTSGSEVLTRQVKLTRSWRLMLSTDKPLYQPGQTILARALALRRPDLKPVAQQSAVFTLTDPRGNVLFKHIAATSAFGITSATCALDQEILEGNYTLACRVGDTESKLSLDIRRYTLPKFKIDVRPDRPYYAPGETARLTVQSDYFFGKPVADAAVAVEVKTLDAGERTVQKLTGQTDQDGSAKLQFTVPAALVGRETDGGDARLRFLVTVTDSAGQKYTTTAERIVTNRPVRIDAIPESGTLVRGVANTVYVLVRKVDGSPVPGVTVEAVGDGIEAKTRTDKRGAASLSVTPSDMKIGVTIRAVAAGGEVLARRHDDLFCGKVSSDFLLRSDRAVYRAGGTINLTALGGGVEPVFVDFIKDGQTLLSQTVEISGGKGVHSFDLPPDVFGTIQLVAYRFTPAGLPVRKVRVLYIEPPDGLKIQATLDRAEYRPGREAKLHLSLTDMNGNPTPGAISLAAVDEAVFAVMAQRPGMEQTFYNLEQDLLKPVYAIYPWMPGVEGGAIERDRALFSTTARAVGDPAPDRGQGEQISSLQAVGPHSLSANSLPEKRQSIQRLRNSRLDAIRMGWIFLALGALAVAYSGLWVFLSVGNVLKIHAVAGVVIVLAGMAVLIIGWQPGSKFDMTRSVGMAKDGAQRDFFTLAEGKSAARAPTAAPPDQAALPDGTVNAVGIADSAQDANSHPPPRLRQFFPETLLWKPELITNDQGHLEPLTIHLADSITTWRLAASAVAADGRMGSAQLPVKVFQPFFVDLNLPVSLTRLDEVGVPVVVYNYLARPQTVTLTVAKADWFTLAGPDVVKLDLAANEIRSIRLTLTARAVGTHKLRVTALAGTIGDAIEREIEVVPDGRRIESVQSGTLDRPVSMNLDVPATAIEGSVKAFVKLYPSSFSQVVEGLDNIFQMPSGCFEQTSSTTYPNVLALDYLRRNKQSAPQVEAKARQYIHLGYQRLVGFEVPGGGFDWFGRPPANRTLTAYGLMEFQDMARVHDVDPRLIERTRNWLLAQRKPDGSWEPEGHAMHDDVLRADERLNRLATTAHIAWAVFANHQSDNLAQRTRDYLLAHAPEDIKNAHVLALVCNALLTIGPGDKRADEYVDHLAALRKTEEGGKRSWWEQSPGARTMFHGAGQSAQVETTALAAIALIQAKRHPEATRGALTWLVSQKDARGTWYSTQATVLSLRALLAATGQSLGGDGERRFELRLGQHVEQFSIPADQAEVMKQFDVSKHIAAGASQTLSLTEKTRTAAGYQVVLRYHIPESKKQEKAEPLTITIDYDRTNLALGDVVKAKATVANRMPATAPMVMLDVPVPPGFTASIDTFEALVKAGKIARYQARPRNVLVYLRGLEPGKPLELSYTLRATMPVKAASAGGRVYEYYDPQKEGRSPATRFTVK
jgi:uncharacterized protein YfaS (alpha-2-macroglobulin family)